MYVRRIRALDRTGSDSHLELGEVTVCFGPNGAGKTRLVNNVGSHGEYGTERHGHVGTLAFDLELDPAVVGDDDVLRAFLATGVLVPALAVQAFQAVRYLTDEGWAAGAADVILDAIVSGAEPNLMIGISRSPEDYSALDVMWQAEGVAVQRQNFRDPAQPRAALIETHASLTMQGIRSALHSEMLAELLRILFSGTVLRRYQGFNPQTHLLTPRLDHWPDRIRSFVTELVPQLRSESDGDRPPDEACEPVVRLILEHCLRSPDTEICVAATLDDEFSGLIQHLIEFWDFRTVADDPIDFLSKLGERASREVVRGEATMTPEELVAQRQRRAEAWVEHARAWLPRFIVDQYTLEADVTRDGSPPVRPRPSDDQPRQSPLDVWRVQKRDGTDLAADELSTGEALWLAFALGLGAPPPTGPGALASKGRHRLMLFDEPERHLHPLAQHDVADLLLRLAAEGNQLLIATHSPELLSLDGAETRYFGMATGGSGARCVEATDRLLEVVGDAASGFAPIHRIQLARTCLLVEGAHDRDLLQGRYGDHLARQRALVIPLRGHNNAMSIPDLEVLAALDKRLVVMLDRIRADRVQQGVSSGRSSGLTDEELTLWHLIRDHHRSDRQAPLIATLDFDDVIAVVDDAFVQRVAAADGVIWPGWDEVERTFRQGKTASGGPPNFKTVAASAAGITGPKAGSRFARLLLDQVDTTTGIRPEADLQLRGILDLLN